MTGLIRVPFTGENKEDKCKDCVFKSWTSNYCNFPTILKHLWYFCEDIDEGTYFFQIDNVKQDRR